MEHGEDGQMPEQDDPFAPPSSQLPSSFQPPGLTNLPMASDGTPLAPGRTMVWPPVSGEKPPPAVVTLSAMTESCIFKSAIAAVGGGVMGGAAGLFFGGYTSAVDKAVDMEGSTALKLRVGMREAGRNMLSYAKGFAKFGAVFSIAECVIERARARHDIFNSTAGGCVAGAAMAAAPRTPLPAKVRASQMAMGCGSVAVFSAAIDYYMEYMD